MSLPMRIRWRVRLMDGRNIDLATREWLSAEAEWLSRFARMVIRQRRNEGKNPRFGADFFIIIQNVVDIWYWV